MWGVDDQYPAVPGRWGLASESSPALGDAAEEWLTWLAAARAPKTGPVYRTPLRLFVAHIGSAAPLAALTPGMVAAWIATLYSGRRRNSVCMYVSAIRSFLRWCWRSGYTPRDVGSYIEPPRREESARWPVPTAGVRALLAAAVTPTERALVLVLYGCGLRVSEAVGLRWADIDLEGGRALVRGKGSKQRYVGLGKAVTAALEPLRGPQGQATCPPSLAAEAHGLVQRAGTFSPGGDAPVSDYPAPLASRERIVERPCASHHSPVPRRPDHSTTGPFPYTSRWAEKRIDIMAWRAGLGHLTPHQLRHSFADALVDGDMPILQLKDLMGHSSLETTMAYLRARDKQRAVEALRRQNPADRLGA